MIYQIDPSAISDMVGMYRLGMTVDEIASFVGYKRDVVLGRLKKSGVQLRRPGTRIGSPAWNKDQVYSSDQKARLNMSGLLKGRAWNRGLSGHLSKDALRKMSEAHTGKCREQSSHWKGGVSFTNPRKAEAPRYKAWRSAVFERDNFTCQKCGTRSGNGGRAYLEAHHIRPFSKFPEFRYDVNNGITLCLECHAIEDKYRGRFVKIGACLV
jgi:5-methylcytosine-specific restriction endonuclease McrA